MEFRRRQEFLALFIITTILILITPTTILHVKSLIVNPYATRVIDGDPSDWIGVPPTADNSYTYSNGEWIWRDAVNDIQKIPSVDQTGADVIELRITSNKTHLFILIVLNNITIIGELGALGVFITIDIDHVANSGSTYFGYVGTETEVAVSGDANWERQIVISLSSPIISNGKPVYGDGSKFIGGGGGGPLDVLDENYNDVSTNSSVFVVNTKYNVIEAAISWSDLGIDPTIFFSGGNYLRIEVITTGVTTDGYTIDDNADPTASDAVDAMSTLTTTDEVKDNHVDYYVDVQFTSDPQPVPEPGPVIAATIITTVIAFIIIIRRKYLRQE